ncbi:MAG: hypothetical protein IAE80_02645, partial [Anaerolinea sp.]|nr:hypothetical protein [Anaerolinea sp.]
YGEYDLSAHGLLWLIAVLPLVLLVTAITVLSTSRAGSRRTAILFSLLLIPVVVYLYFNAVMTLGNIGRFVHPFYGLGLMDVYLAGDDFRPALAGDIAGMLLLFVLIFGAVWGLAWANARLTEAR